MPEGKITTLAWYRGFVRASPAPPESFRFYILLKTSRFPTRSSHERAKPTVQPGSLDLQTYQRGSTRFQFGSTRLRISASSSRLR